MEDVVGVCLEPCFGLFDNRNFDVSQQHDVQHRVVGDKHIWGMGLHVPPAAHLGTIETLQEVALRIVVAPSIEPLVRVSQNLFQLRGLV